jgi:predicted nuclease of restriction endonuclease-like (RecB) superfamily
MICACCEKDIPNDFECIEMNALSKINDDGYRVVRDTDYYCLQCILRFSVKITNLENKNEKRTT